MYCMHHLTTDMRFWGDFEYCIDAFSNGVQKHYGVKKRLNNTIQIKLD